MVSRLWWEGRKGSYLKWLFGIFTISIISRIGGPRGSVFFVGCHFDMRLFAVKRQGGKEVACDGQECQVLLVGCNVESSGFTTKGAYIWDC